MRRRLALCPSAALLLAAVAIPTAGGAQEAPPADSGWVRLAYTITTDAGATLATVNDSVRTGRWAWERTREGRVPQGADGAPIRVPVRRLWESSGCKVGKRQAHYLFTFRRPPAISGRADTPPQWLTLQVGNHPAKRDESYGGPGTYELEWPPATERGRPRRAWDFRANSKEAAWRESASATAASRARVTVNTDQRSGSFSLGPYRDRAGRQVTLAGTFSCDLLAWG